MAKIIRAYGERDMNEKMQRWVDSNVYDDTNNKFREDKGIYEGHPALFIIPGMNTECIVYNAKK